FRLVFGMVLQRTAAEMAGVAVVRGGLCGTGPGQTTVTIERDKGFGVHSISSLPPDDTQAWSVPVRAVWRIDSDKGWVLSTGVEHDPGHASDC
ncbi:hypothetical protein AAH559_005472, partial [Salmonella enterica]